MAVDNIKDFSIQWILFGLLFFSLLSFGTLFVSNNNPNALGDSEEIFNVASQNISSKLIQVEADSDIVKNITSKTNPEIGDLGSRDSVATNFEIAGTSKGFWEASKSFIGFIIPSRSDNGNAGAILVSVFGGMIGLTVLFFIIKGIRNGL